MGEVFQTARPDPREGVPTHGVGRAKGKGERMEKRFGKQTTGKLLAAAIGATGLAGLGASQADAALLIDIRATGVTGGTLDNGKSVQVAGVGSVVTLGVFAQVSGTDGVNNETLGSLYGLLQSAGGLKGNLSGGFSGAFTDSGAQNGSVIDWDSDGDLDIGLSPTSSSSTGKFFARNGTAGGFTGLSPISADTAETQVGTFQFTVTSDATGTETVAQFIRRNNNGGNVLSAALWFEDGSTVSKNPSNSTYGVSAQGVSIALIPEPASLGLMALASVGVLGRRRKA